MHRVHLADVIDAATPHRTALDGLDTAAGSDHGPGLAHRPYALDAAACRRLTDQARFTEKV